MKVKVKVTPDWQSHSGDYGWSWVITRSTATDTWLDVNRGRTSGNRESAIEAANAVLDRYLEFLGSRSYTRGIEL